MPCTERHLPKERALQCYVFIKNSCPSCSRRGYHGWCLPRYCLDTVASTQENAWQINVCFKMDTGAEVTSNSDRVYKSMPSAPILQPANRAPLGPARQKLDLSGQFQGTLTADSGSCKQTIYVIKGLNSYLLGFPAINTLYLLQ